MNSRYDCKPDLVRTEFPSYFQALLPVFFPGVQSLTAHAADNEMKKQIADFYNRVARVFGFANHQ